MVGGVEHFVFFHILGIIIPTDFHIFIGVETTNQIYIYTEIHRRDRQQSSSLWLSA